MTDFAWVHMEHGGGDGPRVLFLHGSGAAGPVWIPVLDRLAGSDIQPHWIVVDLPGHGRSGWQPEYVHSSYAAAIAHKIRGEFGGGESDPRVDLVVGHSLGALVALTLANQDYGVTIGAVIAIAMKVRWTQDQLNRRSSFAKRALSFADRARAVRRFALQSGMSDPQFDDAAHATGVRNTGEGYRLAADPAINARPPASPAEILAVMSRVRVPTLLGCGQNDQGVDPADMADTLGARVQIVADAGHNVHIEHPETVAQWIDVMLRNPNKYSERSCA